MTLMTPGKDRDRACGVAIGITGGIACGKSEVGRILDEEGVHVCDADDVAHDIMAPGGAVHSRVVEAFGRGILKEGGEIDRSALGRIVFVDEKKRALLNSLVHPEVCRRCRAWASEVTGKGEVAAVIIPLLYEIEETEPWDAVVCVASSEGRATERLRKKGLTEGDIRARMAAQMPVAEKARRADYVIQNDGDLTDLRENTRSVLKKIIEKERRDHGST